MNFLRALSPARVQALMGAGTSLAVPGLAPQSCVVIRAWTRPLAGGPPQTAMVLFDSCCSASRAICAPGLRRSPWAAGYGEFRRRYLWRSEELRMHGVLNHAVKGRMPNKKDQLPPKPLTLA